MISNQDVVRGVALGACLIAVFGFPRTAEASGFAGDRFGGEHGTVVATNPLGLYYNPGGIGFSDGTHVFVDGLLAVRNLTWNHPLTPLPGGADPTGDSGTAHLLNVFGGPALAVTTNSLPLLRNIKGLTVGAGLFAPFGGNQSWDTNNQFKNTPYSLVADGVQRWHGTDSSLAVVYGTAGAAYKFGPVSVGASGNLVYTTLTQTQAKSFGASVVDSTPGREGRATLDVDGINGSIGVGALVEVVPDRIWLGASYHAMPGFGPQVLKGTLQLTPYMLNNQMLTPVHPPAQHVSFSQSLPDMARVGAKWRVQNDLELRVLGQLTRWSVLQYQCITLGSVTCQIHADGTDATPSPGYVVSNYRRNWNDTYNVRVGASYWLPSKIEIFGGAGYENGAAPDSTVDPSVADGDNLQVSAGLRVPVCAWLHLAGSYTHFQFFDRNVTTSVLALDQQPTKQQDGNGQYAQWYGLFDLNAEMVF